MLAIPQLRAWMRPFIVWIKPLRRATDYVALVSMGLMFVVFFYGHDTRLEIVYGVLLTVYTLIHYLQRRRLIWLFIAVVPAAGSWIVMLGLLNLHNSLWITLPVGLALLMTARVLNTSQRTALEYAGTFVLLVGSVVTVDRTQLFSVQSLGFVLHLVSLLAYGALATRRVPFAGGLLLTVGCTVFAVAHVNVWLIPFGGGLLLLSGTLFLEVRRAAAEHLLTELAVRWQQWK